MKKRYVIGMDFGTLSVRCVIADALTGKTVAESVSEYEHGVMDDTFLDGSPLKSKIALQHPLDYIN